MYLGTQPIPDQGNEPMKMALDEAVQLPHSTTKTSVFNADFQCNLFFCLFFPG